MDAVSISGTVKDVLDGVDKFRGLGITDLVITPVSGDDAMMGELFEGLAKRGS